MTDKYAEYMPGRVSPDYISCKCGGEVEHEPYGWEDVKCPDCGRIGCFTTISIDAEEQAQRLYDGGMNHFNVMLDFVTLLAENEALKEIVDTLRHMVISYNNRSGTNLSLASTMSFIESTIAKYSEWKEDSCES